MGVAGPKERATFSLSPEIKERLEQAVPKSARSRYVEEAIARALREDEWKDFEAFLDELPKGAKSTENSTDLLRRLRAQWDGRPPEILEGRAK
jgi:predicted transcriptional regulator